MKWYKPLPCGKTVKNPLVCDKSNLGENGFTDCSFISGGSVENWENLLMYETLKSKNEGQPDDVLQNIDMLPIFSPRLKNSIIIAGIKEFQFLPIKFSNYNGAITDGFCIANVLNLVEALDMELTIYSMQKNENANEIARKKGRPPMKYVLLSQALEGYDVIRLAEHKQAYFVSEKFMKMFVENNFTGYTFQEVKVV